jgi:hypothetical protein
MSFWIAHPGHWLVTLAYFLPVIAFLVWLVVVQVKQRRENRGSPSDS